jgi:hypothetical protein
MQVHELVEKLKADRRAELAAAETERTRQAEAARAREQDELEGAKSRALWLAPFYAGQLTGGARNGRDLLAVHFDVPGHRRIAMRLVRHSGGWEPAAVGCCDQVKTWVGQCLDGSSAECDTLADALLAAEGEPKIPF